MTSKKDKTYKTVTIGFTPTEEQESLLNRYFGTRRYCWNYQVHLLYLSDYVLNTTSEYPVSTYSLRDHIRKNGDYFITGDAGIINPTLIENAAQDFSLAHKAYLKKQDRLVEKKRNKLKREKGKDYQPTDLELALTDKELLKGKPKYQTKGDAPNSFTLNANNYNTFKIVDGYLNVSFTRKLGRQTFITKRKLNIDGKIKQVTFKKVGNKYYMVIVFETQKLQPIFKKGSKIALDAGIKTAYVTYDGEEYRFYDVSKGVLKLIKKREAIQSAMDMCKKNSKNRANLHRRFLKASKRFIGARNNEQNHFILYLCQNYEVIIIDDMPNIGEGLKSHNYPKMIIAHGQFKRKLKDKAKLYGNQVFLVKKGTPTTQTCSNCNNVKKDSDKLKLEDRTYICDKCGYIEDRDKNASRNVYHLDKKYLEAV